MPSSAPFPGRPRLHAGAPRLLAAMLSGLLLGSAGTLPILQAREQDAGAAVEYTIAVPEANRRYLQVEAMFPAVPGQPLEVHMSRTSPGRYALHEFAKNVFGESAADADGRALRLERSGLDRWTVTDHQGAVRFSYRVYGDTIDGTYLAVDETHAHINVPAALVWAVGLESRPARVRLVPPAGRSWQAATQLFPTGDPLVYTAPNLAYLIDSPIEFGDVRLRTFRVPIREDGPEATLRLALHHEDVSADADGFVRDVERLVLEERAVFGELPAFEPGSYTFIADYLPWAGGDGMEHRNSTVLTSSAPLSATRVGLLGTVAHEFFHAWNVERIRPRDLEPFNLTNTASSPDLWLAEGVTSYYGPLAMARAGFVPLEQTLMWMAGAINAVSQAPGRQLRPASMMSRLAGFVDGARAADRTTLENTFLSYYTWGSAIGLALDLELRGRTGGVRSLDDYMRALWQKFGRPGGRAPGLVDQPYAHDDLLGVLAEVAGDRGFAEWFFRHYVDGLEVPDYARLLEPAGFHLRRAQAREPWVGPLALDALGTGVRLVDLPRAGTPAWNAGLAQDDVILSVGDVAVSTPDDWTRAIAQRRPGDLMTLEVNRRGRQLRLPIVIGENPDLEVVRLERTGSTLTSRQEVFRRAWLASKAAVPVAR